MAFRDDVRDALATGLTGPGSQRYPAGAAALVAALLLVRVTGVWDHAVDTSAAGTLVLLVASAGALGAVVAVAWVASTWARRACDVVLLAASALVILVEQHGPLTDPGRRYPSDEGRLVAQAIAIVAHGGSPYAHGYPAVTQFAGNTPLFGGGAWHIFGYPPLAPELGALLGHLHAAWGTPAVVGMLGLLGTAVVCVAVLPPVWRLFGLAAVIGLTPLTTYAVNGHPAMLALPLLCLACAGWSRWGTSGRLGVWGVVQAVCLGLACAAQQLAWLPAAGLLLSVWLVARAAVGTRPAARLVGRIAALAFVAFALVDLPFVIAGPSAWLSGVLAQFSGPHPVASGQGLVSLSIAVRHGGGAFEFYGYASALLFVGLLVVIALGFRRLAPVVPVVLTLVFLVSIRSQGEYFLTFAPLWVVWAAGTRLPPGLQLSPLLSARRRRIVAAVALAPALICTALAVAVPAPLGLTVRSSSLRHGRIALVRVLVVNRSGAPITPHYYLDPASHLRSPWRVIAGPRSLRAGRQAMVTLVPALLPPERPSTGLRVWALADNPQSMSSAPLSVGQEGATLQR